LFLFQKITVERLTNALGHTTTADHTPSASLNQNTTGVQAVCARALEANKSKLQNETSEHERTFLIFGTILLLFLYSLRFSYRVFGVSHLLKLRLAPIRSC
jgi:hypothetical protein